MKSFIHPELNIPEMGTEEFYAWWESQYAPSESLNLGKTIQQLEWEADGFVGK